MTNTDYTLWPNEGGTLGQIKVQIPDGVTATWPVGDALVHNFVYQNGKLVGFVDTKALIVNDSKTTTFPYEYVNIQVDKSLEGVMSFNKGERTKYLIITYTESGNTGDTIVLGTKYLGCKTVDDIKAINPGYYANDIIDGVWSQSLADLTDGYNMFYKYCTNLTSFNSDLSSLTNGENMFYECTNLASFNTDLSSLTNGEYMFYYCRNLTTFSSDLSSLTNGFNMFQYCDNLTTFSSNLSSLTTGNQMFFFCKLNAPSVKNIIDTINTVSSGSITLGMGCVSTTEDKNLFAQEVGYADMSSLLATIKAKGWNVSAQYNRRPTSTYSLRNPFENTLPIFVKIEEDEKHGRYTSEDGSKKFRLDWFHETTGSTDGYTQFNSLEEAIQHFNIKPIEK